MFEFFAEIILEFVGYNVGFFFLRIFSGGKYPKEYLKDGGELKVEIFRILMILLVLIIITYIFI